MKSWIKLFLKIVGGGFGSVFLLLCGSALKDVLFYISQGKSCEDLIYIPVKILFGLLFVPWWNNWAFLFFAFGVLFILIIQLLPVLNVGIQKHARQIFIALQVTILVIFGVGVNIEIQTELGIKKTYSEFCRAVKDHNYTLAYSYFSPEYRSERGLNRFEKEIIELANSGYIEGCDGEFEGTVSPRLNRASVYPYQYTTQACYLFLGGPELILVRIGGKWYFTGEHHWYVD